MINIGDKIGRWEVLEETHKNGKRYYKCRCECGTEKEVYSRSLEQGSSLSCGCLRKELTHERAMDLTGRRIGRLVVLGRDESKHGFWICECDCGNRKSIRGTSLTHKNPTSSCGCIHNEVIAKAGEKTIAKNSEKQITTNMAFHTNFQVIESKKLPKNNTSGYKGINWDEGRKKWAVWLQVHGKRKYLGRYAKIEDAIEARRKAEELYFAPLIEEKQRRFISDNKETPE